MPLGLAKDSMLNLAELASKNDDEMLLGDSSNHANVVGISAIKTPNIEDGCKRQHRNKYDTHSDDSVVDAMGKTIHSKNVSDERADAKITVTSAHLKNTLTKLENKQTVPEQNKYQYAGFRADYSNFENYTSYNFPGDDAISKHGSSKKNNEENPWWRCIFPWISFENDNYRNETSSRSECKNENDGFSTTKIIDNYDDEISMISTGSDNILGESQTDRQSSFLTSLPSQQDGIESHENENDSFIGETSLKKKSILKCPSRARGYRNLSIRTNKSNGSISGQTQTNQRRSLFPAYEPKSIKKKHLSASFSPMARVVTIKSSKDMNSKEKSRIWWQKVNYDEFRKTGRIISKVMLQGGSEIWLATNQSWQLPNQGKAATLRRAMANVDSEDTSDKWWHKFGHSRRGLEHIASIEEGRQRQANVKSSIRTILIEQRRQKTFHREDTEKLRMCSIQYTSWAKDLALASGASDADAVTKNFDDESRKSREFYLLKFSRAVKLNSNSGTQGGTKQVVPAFMKPMVSMQLRPNRFDANTTSRLKFKNKEVKQSTNDHQCGKSGLAVMIPSESIEAASKQATHIPTHDSALNTTVRESLASKAAGFANGEEAVNMSAVLTGMGAIPQNPDCARSRPVLA